MLLERNRTRRKIDEDVAVPLSDSNRVQRIIGFAEALDFFHVRRVGQRAVELVSPCVILALNAACELAFFLLAEHGSAMTADIVERPDLALIVACDDHAGIGKLAQKIIASIGNLTGAPRA